MSLLIKALKLSINNIWRNKFLSIATIFVIGTIIFIFNIILGINFIVQDSLRDLGKKIDVVVYLKETGTEVDAKNIIDDLKQLDYVENAAYTSKETALEEIQKTHPDLSISFEKYDLGNPLPASINISTKTPQDYEKVVSFLNQPKYQTYLTNISSSDTSSDDILSSVSRNLSSLGRFTNQIIFWLIITFLIGGALIILNALQITIFARKKEIEVMKLVGASLWFIRFPYIIEASVYGISSVIFGFVMLTVLAGKISIPLSAPWLNLFIIELVITVLLSILSSLIAVHEHLFRKSL